MATANGTAALARPAVRSIGFTGLNRWHGLIAEDYLPAWGATQRVSLIPKMCSDGMVQAMLSAVMLPIIAAAWVVEPAGPDAKAKAAAALVEEQLFEKLGCCWEDEVRQLLAYLKYGFHVAAKNWKLDGGQVVLDELRPLHPRTILQGGRNWEFDGQGRVTGVWQYGTDGTTWREEFVPGESLLVLTHQGDYGNPEGQSILRASYKHWLIKDTLYRVQAIGLERSAVGTPIGKYPQGAAKSEQDDFQTALERLIVNESGVIVIPNGPEGVGYEVENFVLPLKTPDLMAAIHHHDAEMAKSVLAGFLNLGQEGAGGAYALSTDQTDLFLLSLESIADYLCARLNRSVVPEIVRYNLGTDQYPKLSATISRRSASALAALLQPLTAGTLSWGEADEDWLREQLQLPERQEPRAKPQPVGAVPKEDVDEELAPGKKLAAGRRELIVLADPPAFREEPAYPEFAAVVDDFSAAVRGLGERYRRQVWQITGLPEVEPETAQFKAEVAFPKLTVLQQKELDAAIDAFLVDFFGADRTLAGFVGVESEDALLQGFLRLAHGVGVQRARRLTRAETAAFRPTRESPQIKRLLTDSFNRLSQDGQLRLGGQLGEVKDILTDGALKGRNSFDVAKELDARFDKYSRYEFERLARTEASFANNAGIVDELSAEGVKVFEVLVSPLACPICQGHAGAKVPAAKARVGETIPPFHVQCLCSTVADVASLFSLWGWEFEYSDSEHPRDKSGKFAPKGGGYREATEEDRKGLKVPKAYTDVYVPHDPETASYIWVARDAKGRPQQRQNPRVAAENAAEKFARVRELSGVMPQVEKAIEHDMARGPHQDTALAMRLISRSGFRVGSERETLAAKKAFGTTTLTAEHVRVEGDRMHFDFIGKEGVRQQHTIEDAKLARHVEARAATGGRLFNTNDARCRSYLKRVGGNSDFTTKDLRTHVGTSTAVDEVSKRPVPKTQREFTRARMDVARAVSARLGNRPEQALARYIAPEVFSPWIRSLDVTKNE